MLITAGPSTTASFATKLVSKTRIDPEWKIALPEVAVKVVKAVRICGRARKSDREGVDGAEYTHRHIQCCNMCSERVVNMPTPRKFRM